MDATSQISQGLSAGLATAAVGFALRYLLRSTQAVARQDGGTMVVEYSRAMKLLVVICWLCGGGGCVAAAYASAAERKLAFGVVGAFFLLVLFLHLEFFHVSVRYDTGGLHLTSPWRRRRFVPWSAITGASFSALSQWYVLCTAGYGRIRLHLYLSGLQSLLEELARRGHAIPPAISGSRTFRQS